MTFAIFFRYVDTLTVSICLSRLVSELATEEIKSQSMIEAMAPAQLF